MPGPDLFALFRLFTRRNFLDPAICASLQTEMASATRHETTVHKEEGRYETDESVRSARWVEVSGGTVSLVESRLLALKPELEKHFHLTLQGVQSSQFLIYGKGHHYQPHRDNSDDPEAPEFSRRRLVSTVIFVNGESQDPAKSSYGGGALTFYGLMKGPQGEPLGLPLAGEPGLLVAFPSHLIHGVEPVTHGERCTIASWYF